jgi:ABC-2 type transport system ATP-binding protein
MEILRIEHLHKVIKKRQILTDINLEVNTGEIVGFLGPNGAGKTTTIKMIMGLFGISQGNIFIDGVDVEKDFENAMKHVGGIVENPDLYKHLTGYQNLEYYAGMHEGVGASDIDQIIEIVKMKDRVKDKVKTYSLGMRQRIGLAQALLHKPKLLILDEPTNGLDPLGIKELRDLLKQLAKMGVGILVSSHLLSEMEMMCDRIYIIDDGAIIGQQVINDDDIDLNDQSFDYELISSDDEKVVELLNAREIASQRSNKGITFNVKGSHLSEVLKDVIASDILIYAANRKQRTLEDDFISITEGTKGQIK